MVDLNTMIDPASGWLLLEARGINDIGQISGWGLRNGQPRGLLLSPVPEPSTLALAGFVVATLAAWAWRRTA